MSTPFRVIFGFFHFFGADEGSWPGGCCLVYPRGYTAGKHARADPLHRSEAPEAPEARADPLHRSEAPEAPEARADPLHRSEAPEAPEARADPLHREKRGHVIKKCTFINNKK